MTDYISRQILKRKALARWENEGGRICADQAEIIESGSPDERAGKDNAAPKFKSPTADRFKRRRKSDE